jgi:hypothetical protein
MAHDVEKEENENSEKNIEKYRKVLKSYCLKHQQRAKN